MQIAIRDLLFINYAVAPDRVRALVPDRFNLDTKPDREGNPRAFVSAVPFRVAEIRSTALPFRASFNQINYRVYIESNEGLAVYFLDLRVDSRSLAAMAGFLSLPLSYEAITMNASGGHSTGDEAAPQRFRVESEGAAALGVDVTLDAALSTKGDGSDPDVSSEFITERPFGFIRSGARDMYKLSVEHSPLEAVGAHVNAVRSSVLESLGILNAQESLSPHSVFYVRETLFDVNTPTKV